MTVTREVYKRAVKASDDLVLWAVKTYPILTSENLPRVLSTYVFAAAVFRESGYTWFETSDENAFVPLTLIKEKYSMIPVIRSQYVVRDSRGVLTYYAANARFVEYIGNATYYLPTVDELKEIVETMGRFQNLAPLLVLPTRVPVIKKILEVHLRGRSTI